jgi:hypothetical protein
VEEAAAALPQPFSVTHTSAFEWRETAHWAGLTWPQWLELHPLERAAYVAHYRQHHRLQAVLQYRASRRRST